MRWAMEPHNVPRNGIVRYVSGNIHRLESNSKPAGQQQRSSPRAFSRDVRNVGVLRRSTMIVQRIRSTIRMLMRTFLRVNPTWILISQRNLKPDTSFNTTPSTRF
eukprot:PhF_6_TR11587/c0_g1_i2/m.18749